MVATFSGISVRAVSLEVFGLLTAPALTAKRLSKSAHARRQENIFLIIKFLLFSIDVFFGLVSSSLSKKNKYVNRRMKKLDFLCILW